MLSVLPRSHASDQSSNSLPNERDEVLQAFDDYPNTSQRKVAEQCEVSLLSVNRISDTDTRTYSLFHHRPQLGAVVEYRF